MITFVSDNEAMMTATRKLIAEWRPHLIVLGCSAHYFNLVENVASLIGVMGHVTRAQRHFREHYKETVILKERGAAQRHPLDSQRACLDTFVKNHAVCMGIRDILLSFDLQVAKLVDNGPPSGGEAPSQLSKYAIAKTMMVLQDDHTTLVEAYNCWMGLMTHDIIQEIVRHEIKRRFDQVISKNLLFEAIIC